MFYRYWFRGAVAALLVSVSMAGGCGGQGRPLSRETRPPATMASTPGEIIGSYESTISKKELERKADVFAARFERRSRWRLDIHSDRYELSSEMMGDISERLTIEGKRIVIRDFGAPQGVFLCEDGRGDRLAAPKKGMGVYSFDVDRGSLRLEAEREQCPLRAVLLERSWRLTG